jgi:hypothetical protein
MDLRGSIPCFACITHGKTHDTTALDELPIEPGSFYIMDRGYVDFARLYRFNNAMSYFVVRSKTNLNFRCRIRRPVDKTTGLRCDQTIVLRGPRTSLHYPIPLRRITFFDHDSQKLFHFVTNAFDLPAITIAQMYKSRWQIELFFKWLKQHLHIKAFYGTTPNAVKTQIWIAIAVYVLVAIIKRRLDLPHSLNEILQILSITLFEKSPINEVFADSNEQVLGTLSCNQLQLLDF